MTPADTLTERQTYLEGGLTEVSCEHCGVRVRARKASAQQTSVQWTAPAARSCPRLAEAAGARPTALVPGCPDLRDSIDGAVREGRLEVSR